MQRFGFLPALVFASFLMLAVAFGEDASDSYLGAYQDFQTAEKLEREGKPREALGKYQDAEKVLSQIRKDEPDWQPLVVEYRLKKTQEAIGRLQSEVAKLPAAVEPIEGPMPEPERETPRPSRRESTSSGPVIVTQRPTKPRTTRDLSESDLAASPSSSELQQLRRQLEEARAENKRLENKLEQKNGELQMTLRTLDKTKVSLVEVKSDLAQANAALEDAQKDGSAGAALRAQFDKKAADIIRKLSEMESNNQVLEEENTRLLAKLEDAAKYIGSSDEIREGLLKERQKFADERDEAVKKAKRVKDNSVEIERVAGENKDLKTKLAESEKTAKSKAEDADKLLRENKSLTNKLAEALLNAPGKAEIEKLVAQRDSLQKKLAGLEKEKAAAPAATPDPAKDKQIASLQSDLNTANDRLLEAQSQVSQREDKLRDLQKQLDQATGELAQLKINPSPSKEEKSLIAENELLRQVIMRQIKDQTRRDEASKAVEVVLNASPDKLNALRPHIAVLSEPTLKLTEEERALFRDPVSLLTQSGGDESMSVAVAVTKPTEAEAKENKENSQPEKTGKEEALPADVRVQFEEAKKLFEAGNFDGAEKVFQGIVEVAPNNYYILSNLGAVQIESGKLSAAEVALKKAIKIRDSESYAHRNLGIVYSRQGKIDAAIGSLRRAVAADAKDAVAHNYLGVCLGQKEDRPEAEKEFKDAISIDPDYAAAHFNLAVLYATTQPPSLQLAKQHYSKATQLGAPPDASLERLIQ